MPDMEPEQTFVMTATFSPTGDAQVDDALGALTHLDRDVRQAAALRVGELAHPGAAPELVARLWSEQDPFVRETLTWAITRVRSATPLLLEALASTDPGTRERALHVLSKVADPATLDAILPLTSDADPHVAAKARWALTRLGDPRGVPAVVAHLAAGDDTVRNGVTRDLASFGAVAVPALVAVLASGATDNRRHAAEVLCLMGPGAEGATDALSEALDDPDGTVRVSAAMALLDLGTPAALDALSRDTRTQDPRVREIARRAGLRQTGGRRTAARVLADRRRAAGG
ncbi:hypothetical protein GCM10023113_04260 [Cellulomonas oligotrophica]|uniref:Uncharacterized protein n=1 Tax=Cellulomonas oligotrophica TaxID=931536 RepID=A0ABQ4D9X0_9CELL|nr:hypothetical protein Col01nite_16750 [Cellulomonas oligotrophica]